MVYIESVRLRAIPYVVAQKGVGLVATPEPVIHKENDEDSEGIPLGSPLFSSVRTLCDQKSLYKKELLIHTDSRTPTKGDSLRQPTRR